MDNVMKTNKELENEINELWEVLNDMVNTEIKGYICELIDLSVELEHRTGDL